MTLEPLIHVLDKRLALHQPLGGFRSGIDAVLLAAACPAPSGSRLLDMGCGIGTAGLCVLARQSGVILSGFDIQEGHVTLAQKNAALNNFSDARFSCEDVCSYIDMQDGKNKLFDHVICNPPYNESGAHTPSPSGSKALAMGHAETNLKDWIDCANRNLKSGGSFTLIHKADQIDKIFLAMEGRFGGAEIIPLWPHAGEAAKRVIIRTLKDRKSPAIIHAGLVLHGQNGEYTREAEGILRSMKPL